MLNTTLCYIEKDGRYLMLLRNKKENDLNEGKWIGVGGKFEEGETAEMCALREIREETGLEVKKLNYRGTVEFNSDRWPSELMHLFTAETDTEDVIECSEGELEWIEKDKIKDLPLWEGDRIFLKYLTEDAPFFSLRFYYEGDTLKTAEAISN